MARDIYAETLAEMVEICALLTERGHRFDATLTTAGNWRIRLTGAF